MDSNKTSSGRCKTGLVTSGGLYQKRVQPPFDAKREKVEPRWGDPSCRVIPCNITQNEIRVSHLHFNTHFVEQDFNILLPIHCIEEMAEEGFIGSLAARNYSLMGCQGYLPDPSVWQSQYGPLTAQDFFSQGVDCVILAPS